MTLSNFLLILSNACLLVAGQMLWKWGLQGQPTDFRHVRSVLALLVSPPVVGGMVLYAVATILWLFVLSRVPLSIAYPTQSIAYLLGVIGAFVWFGEPITVWKVLGCLLIMAGVSLIGFGPRAS